MKKSQKVLDASSESIDMDIEKLIEDLSSAASTIQRIIDKQEDVEPEAIRFIPPLLKQARQILQDREVGNKIGETKLEEIQQISQGFVDLKTLLEILPLGIIIARDPYNLDLTINHAGMQMLNLPPGIKPVKSNFSGDEVPFKTMRAGKEVTADESPMQYAFAHRVALRDIEMDVHHSNGRVLNLLEYASPMYDGHGNVIGCVGVLVDITVHKSVEKRLVMQYQIARILAESNSVNGAAAQVLQLICETTGWEYGALWRAEPNNKLINEGVWHTNLGNLSQYAEANYYIALNADETNLPGYVYHTGQSLWLSKINEFPSQDAVEAEKAGLCSAFVLPVRSGNRIIAILECLSSRPQDQEKQLVELLNAVVNQIGIFLERKLLEEALTNRANQQNLLANAGIALSGSLDYVERLQAIVNMIVPDFADWCAFDLIDQNNILSRVAAAHVDPNKLSLVYQNQQTRKVDFNHVKDGQVETLLTGKSLLYTEIPPSLIEKTIVDPEKLKIIQQLNPESFIIVPLNAHGRIFGICSFVQSDSKRRYSTSDLVLAEDIVHRAALAVDNALLYAESKKLNIDLESRVSERTAQLEIAINELKKQVADRQYAEEQVRILNSELEERIFERTSQLELANHELNKEVSEHQQARLSLRILLKRTRELYRISQTIGTLRTPNELLSVLISSSYLKDASRASIAILDKPWKKNETPPENCRILAEWNNGSRQPRFFERRFTLEEYGITSPTSYGEPIVIPDIQSVMQLPEIVRKRFADLHTHSLIILPLVAGGEWYGLLSLHFKTRRMTNMDDLRHMRGLVDQTAIAIDNMRLLAAESQARRDAEKANDLKLKFLAMISHELRTPLASIKGFTTTLLAEDVVWPADKQLDFLQTINSESDKLSDLIEQLLDLSRMEAGILRVSPRKVFLKNILDLALVQLQAITTEHELVLDIPPDLPPIFGDGPRIAQVLTNLVSNAAKFSPPRTQIIISAHRSAEMIQIDVTDQGPGIPSQDHPRVFTAFRQLENGADNRTKGAGLGLAICKGLIETQGGQIWIQTQKAQGTIVSFTLPIHGSMKKSDPNQ